MGGANGVVSWINILSLSDGTGAGTWGLLKIMLLSIRVAHGGISDTASGQWY